MTHWIPWLTIHSLAEDWRFDRYGIPMELYKLIQLVPDTMPMQYLPVLYTDRLRVMKKDLKVRNSYGLVSG